MQMIKNTALAFLAAAMSVTSLVAMACDWNAMQRSKIDAAQAIVIAKDRVKGQAVELTHSYCRSDYYDFVAEMRRD